MSASPLRQIQEDAEARIKAEPFFATIPTIKQRNGETLAEIQKRVATLTGKGGKVGACILILMPGGGVPDQTPGPRLALTVSFVVLVHPAINDGSTGTKLDVEAIAIELLQLFDQTTLGYGSVLQSGQDALVPNDSFDGLVGYQVNLGLPLGLVKKERVAVPTISATATTAPATVTLTCATAGAAIRYSVDDSYPTLPYTAPFVQSTAATIRAAAEKAGLQQSNIRQLTLS